MNRSVDDHNAVRRAGTVPRRRGDEPERRALLSSRDSSAVPRRRGDEPVDRDPGELYAEALFPAGAGDEPPYAFRSVPCHDIGLFPAGAGMNRLEYLGRHSLLGDCSPQARG